MKQRLTQKQHHHLVKGPALANQSCHQKIPIKCVSSVYHCVVVKLHTFCSTCVRGWFAIVENPGICWCKM
jgi:hypothetical protein